ncbi:hypothetical protein EDB87DRAFT_1823633 [Lactarius vividus]|nr:hypothetical protein EDB87DRAFT_1823633 [Lactarius vividus]
MVDDKRVVLVEAKSPSVMKTVGSSLPEDTVELDWAPGGDLVSKILLEAALYLGLSKMEWLFLTCHNNWIVCRLVSDKDTPFLAFSPMFNIEGSSQPFRAFLGAILSVLKGTPVQASKFNPPLVLDTISEEGGGGSSSEDDNDDASGEYRGSSTTNISSKLPMTRSRATTSRDAAKSDLMDVDRPGNVWECRFDNSDNLFAIKVVKLQHKSDVERQRRFNNEFEVYLSLEIAYQSGQLRDRITPHCYGAFEGNGTDVLILGLCGDTLKDWDELKFSERTQIYGLVWDLHRVGIVHGDLEPRNVARVPGGGFHLIDFSESVRHSCVEISGKLKKRYECPELRAMRGALKLLQRHASMPMLPSLSSPAAVNN